MNTASRHKTESANTIRSSGVFDGVLMALAISLAFMGGTYLRVIGDAGSAALGGTMFNTILAQPIWGTHLGHELIKFVASVFFVHALLAITCWCLARATLRALPDCGTSQRTLTVFWCLVLIIWVVAANAYQFPRTSLGSFWHPLARTTALGIPVFGMLTTGLVAAIATVFIAAAIRCSSFLRQAHRVWIGAACLSAAAAIPVMTAANDSSSNVSSDRPHVILIGIDSLRADFTQNTDNHWTPAIDGFLNDAVTFQTPIRRWQEPSLPGYPSSLDGTRIQQAHSSICCRVS